MGSLWSPFPYASCPNWRERWGSTDREAGMMFPQLNSMQPWRRCEIVSRKEISPCASLGKPTVSRLPMPAHPGKGCRTPTWLGTKSSMNSLALLWSSACAWGCVCRLAWASHGDETVTSQGLLSDCSALQFSYVSFVTAKAALISQGEEDGQSQACLGWTLDWLHVSTQEYSSPILRQWHKSCWIPSLSSFHSQWQKVTTSGDSLASLPSF